MINREGEKYRKREESETQEVNNNKKDWTDIGTFLFMH